MKEGKPVWPTAAPSRRLPFTTSYGAERNPPSCQTALASSRPFVLRFSVASFGGASGGGGGEARGLRGQAWASPRWWLAHAIIRCGRLTLDARRSLQMQWSSASSDLQPPTSPPPAPPPAYSFAVARRSIDSLDPPVPCWRPILGLPERETRNETRSTGQIGLT